MQCTERCWFIERIGHVFGHQRCCQKDQTLIYSRTHSHSHRWCSRFGEVRRNRSKQPCTFTLESNVNVIMFIFLIGGSNERSDSARWRNNCSKCYEHFANWEIRSHYRSLFGYVAEEITNHFLIVILISSPRNCYSTNDTSIREGVLWNSASSETMNAASPILVLGDDNVVRAS